MLPAHVRHHWFEPTYILKTFVALSTRDFFVGEASNPSHFAVTFPHYRSNQNLVFDGVASAVILLYFACMRAV